MVNVRKEFISCPVKLKLDQWRCVSVQRSGLMNPIRLFPPHNLYIWSEKSSISSRNDFSTCHCAKTILFYYYNVISNARTNNPVCANKQWRRCYLITRWREKDFLTYHRCWIRCNIWNILFLTSICFYQLACC